MELQEKLQIEDSSDSSPLLLFLRGPKPADHAIRVGFISISRSTAEMNSDISGISQISSGPTDG